jgi:hypothetical protein
MQRLREVTISGTHEGDLGALRNKEESPVSSRRPFLFGTGEYSDKLIAERIYFDNER